jgi:hypothetical protein
MFYTIQSKEFGIFYGYKRRPKDFWAKRPAFGRDARGPVKIFLHEREAYDYIRSHHTLPFDCTVRFSDLDAQGKLYNTLTGDQS